MKNLSRVFLFLFCISLATADSPNKSPTTQLKYSEVRIFATSESDVKKIQDAGLFIDHANTKLGYYSDVWLSEFEIELLRKSGVPYQMLIDDWDVYYNSLPGMTQAEMDEALRQSARQYNVSHSIFGSMGGYLTYAEVVAKLDSMRLEYPNYISQKFSIGTTIENRIIWAVRITKNPDAPTGRPEALYHALIHAREPESMETQMYYFYWLFENYGADGIATYILNNREIYWVPVLNPDGYVYNQNTYPGGGGMWRENRRFNYAGCYGVDLNRNYGTYQFWNSSNGGSSTIPTCGGGTYRGPSPFSEPETQAIMNFVNSRNFNVSFGAHTYGNWLIKPWAWIDPTPTPDDNKFNQFLADMRASNPAYRTGTPSQTVGYYVRGGSDDWYYNDSVHTGHHIFGMTPETGTSFWPPQSEIIPLAQGMFFNNQYMSLIAGPYVNPLSKTFDQPTYIPGQPGTYKVVFKNKGAMDAANVTVLWTSVNSNITIPTTQFTYPSLASFATDSSLFNFSISSSVQDNSAIPTLLTIKLDTTTIYTSPAYVLVGTGTVVLNDDGSTFGNWTTNGTWAVTTSQYHSPPSSFTDSPAGNYGNNANNSMTLASPINATSTPVLILNFYHKYATEANYDFCNVEVSSDNGTTWQPVVSYTGTLSAWTQQRFDISSYANASSQVKIRFRLTSDASVTADGWYVDDIRMNGYPISVDTGMVVRPSHFNFAGHTGRIFRDSLKIVNLTSGALQISVTETTGTLAASPPSHSVPPGAIDLESIIKKVRPALAKVTIPRSVLKRPVETPTGPETFTTIITDDRNEGTLGAADIYRVDYQLRTLPLLGTFHDFRVVLGDVPDTDIVAFISLDTDQDFGTGAFPTPLGLGPPFRDIGSEREILLDASGRIMDSLGFGRIPAGIVISTATDSLVGFPFPLSITRDTVLTINTGTEFTGVLDQWLGDPDRMMNVGVVASRTKRNVSPLPDFAPLIGHGTIGTERDVSWITEDTTSLTIPSGDSAVVHVTTLAAKPPGTYTASLQIRSTGRPTVSAPITMVVLATPIPRIAVAPRSFSDTLAFGDSTTHPLSISNVGEGRLTFGIVDISGTPWLFATPFLGNVDSGQTILGTVFIRTAGLTQDSTYTARLFVVSDDPDSNLVPVDVTLRTLQPTAVRGEGSKPIAFSLQQNYPNPFNPETNIKFDLPSKQFVSLRVYNLLGQEVVTLVNEELAAGRYSLSFQSGRYTLASGVYLYRIVAGNFVEVKKMILMK